MTKRETETLAFTVYPKPDEEIIVQVRKNL